MDSVKWIWLSGVIESSDDCVHRGDGMCEMTIVRMCSICEWRLCVCVCVRANVQHQHSRRHIITFFHVVVMWGVDATGHLANLDTFFGIVAAMKVIKRNGRGNRDSSNSGDWQNQQLTTVLAHRLGMRSMAKKKRRKKKGGMNDDEYDNARTSERASTGEAEMKRRWWVATEERRKEGGGMTAPTSDDDGGRGGGGISRLGS